MAVALKENVFIMTLNICKASTDNNIIVSNQLGDKGAEHIAAAIKENKVLKELDLGKISLRS